ncbi:MAG: serine/threonine protein kinase, partial [Gemmataceae bacterium]|nr:serine/threonine protein kinase [Gemmataceae bacterium]
QGPHHASGGLGDVFHARDGELEREVALKRIKPQHAADAEACRRFLEEARITGRLEHPGIVPVYGLGVDEAGQPYYAMRFIQGDTLQQAIAKGAPLRSLLARFVAVCQTLAYAHSRGVIHRDLKPANVILGPFGETLVLDWGLALDLASRGRQPPEEQGGIAGTPQFMSPEQAEGHAPSPSCDVYGLGAILYAILAGEAPIEGRSVREVLDKARRGEFRPPTARRPGVPRALEAVCLKAMALKPEDRYPSAQALADDAQRWLDDEPTLACPEPWTQRAGRWIRKHPALCAVAAVLLLAGLVGGFFVQEARGRASVAEAREEAEKEAAARNLAVALETGKTVLEQAKGFQAFARIAPTRTVGLLESALASVRATLEPVADVPEVRTRRAEILLAASETWLDLGRTGRALEAATEAQALLAGLHEDDPRREGGAALLARAHYRRAFAHHTRGEERAFAADAARALELQRAATATLESELDLVRTLDLLGRYATTRKRLREAGRLLAEARRRLEKLRARHGDAGPIAYQLARTLEAQGTLAYEEWEDDASLAVLLADSYKPALAIMEALVRREPDNAVWLAYRQSLRLETLGLTHYMRDDPSPAAGFFRLAKEQAEQWLAVDPGNAEQQRRRLNATLLAEDVAKGDPVAALGRKLEALDAHLPAMKAMADADPRHLQRQSSYGTALQMKGQALLALIGQGKQPASRFAEARGLLADSLKRADDECSRFPEALAPLGRYRSLSLMLGKIDGDLALIRRGQERWLKAAEARLSDEPGWQRERVGAWTLLGLSGHAEGTPGRLAALETAARLAEEALRLHPRDRQLMEQAAKALEAVSAWHQHGEQPGLARLPGPEMLDPLRRAGEWWRKRLALTPGNARVERHLLDCESQLLSKFASTALEHRAEAMLPAYLDALAAHSRRATPSAAPGAVALFPLTHHLLLAKEAPATARLILAGQARRALLRKARPGWHRSVEDHAAWLGGLALGAASEAEEHWTGRRLLALLREGEAAGWLHAYHRDLRAAASERLAHLRLSPAARGLGSEAARAWRSMDWRALARLEKAGTMARLIDEDAASASALAWPQESFVLLLLDSLLHDPAAARAVVAAASRESLSLAGKDALAKLALALDDLPAARALRPLAAFSPADDPCLDAIALRACADRDVFDERLSHLRRVLGRTATRREPSCFLLFQSLERLAMAARASGRPGEEVRLRWELSRLRSLQPRHAALEGVREARLAAALLLAGDPRRAEARATRAISLLARCRQGEALPALAEAHLARAGARRLMGRAKEALGDADRAGRIDPSPAQQRERARCLHALGRHAEAQAALRRSARRLLFGQDVRLDAARTAEDLGYADLAEGLRAR